MKRGVALAVGVGITPAGVADVPVELPPAHAAKPKTAATSKARQIAEVFRKVKTVNADIIGNLGELAYERELQLMRAWRYGFNAERA